MHELSLIQSVMTAVKNNAAENHIKTITKIGLVVGRFSNAVAESLIFAFETFKQDEVLFAQAELEIRQTQVTCRCRQCGHQYAMEGRIRFVCPRCQGNDIDITGGRELYVDYYEGDEE